MHCLKSANLLDYLISYFSGLYLGLQSAKYLCMHDKYTIKYAKALTVYKLHTLKFLEALKTNGFQQYALFERRVKLFYMILPLADARWRRATRYPGVLRGASNSEWT